MGPLDKSCSLMQCCPLAPLARFGLARSCGGLAGAGGGLGGLGFFGVCLGLGWLGAGGGLRAGGGAGVGAGLGRGLGLGALILEGGGAGPSGGGFLGCGPSKPGGRTTWLPSTLAWTTASSASR